jgi:hypothetical protein
MHKSEPEFFSLKANNLPVKPFFCLLPNPDRFGPQINISFFFVFVQLEPFRIRQKICIAKMVFQPKSMMAPA